MSVSISANPEANLLSIIAQGGEQFQARIAEFQAAKEQAEKADSITSAARAEADKIVAAARDEAEKAKKEADAYASRIRFEADDALGAAREVVAEGQQKAADLVRAAEAELAIQYQAIRDQDLKLKAEIAAVQEDRRLARQAAADAQRTIEDLTKAEAAAKASEADFKAKSDKLRQVIDVLA